MKLAEFDRDGGVPHASPSRRAAAASRLYRERRARDAGFGRMARVFRDPAWDIALHLFVAGEEGRRVCASAASAASRTPMTTGLRCVDAMVDAGLVWRQGDPDDARRCFVALTPAARQAMNDFLDDLPGPEV